MSRFHLAEPFVMLAAVLRWLSCSKCLILALRNSLPQKLPNLPPQIHYTTTESRIRNVAGLEVG